MNYKQKAVAKFLSGNTPKIDSFNMQGNQAQIQKNNLQLLQAFGNPIFDAQFDLKVTLKYYTESGGVYTEIAAAALNATLKTRLPVFFYGHTDQAGGFANMRANYPVNVWAYNDMFVYGVNQPRSSFSNLDATAKSALTLGDLVLPFTATVAGPINTVALVILSSSNVAYGTLLNALSSDIFYTCLIRYVIADALVTQLNNKIGTYTMSLFGATKADSINPTAFKQPDQQQAGIVDMPVGQGIDKNVAWATYVNYDAVFFTLQIFANGVDKLRAM